MLAELAVERIEHLARVALHGNEFGDSSFDRTQGLGRGLESLGGSVVVGLSEKLRQRSGPRRSFEIFHGGVQLLLGAFRVGGLLTVGVGYQSGAVELDPSRKAKEFRILGAHLQERGELREALLERVALLQLEGEALVTLEGFFAAVDDGNLSEHLSHALMNRVSIATVIEPSLVVISEISVVIEDEVVGDVSCPAHAWVAGMLRYGYIRSEGLEPVLEDLVLGGFGTTALIVACQEVKRLSFEFLGQTDQGGREGPTTRSRAADLDDDDFAQLFGRPKFLAEQMRTRPQLEKRRTGLGRSLPFVG